MAISQTQKRYAVTRLESVLREKVKGIEDEISAQKKKLLTTGEKLALIRDGKVKLVKERAVVQSHRYEDSPILVDCFDYPDDIRRERENARLQEGADTRIHACRLAAGQLRDAIMLSEPDDLLAKLQAFEERKF